MSQEDVDLYRKALLLYNNELLELIKIELQGHIDFIDTELKRRNKK
jgi:hypothetical protein